jgi:hypothetical protein
MLHLPHSYLGGNYMITNALVGITALFLLATLPAGAEPAPAPKVLKWSSFELDWDAQTQQTYFVADAEGKIPNSEGKKFKVRAEYTLAIDAQIEIKGRNPVSGGAIQDAYPLVVGGINKASDLPLLFGEYLAKMTRLNVLLGVGPAFYKLDSSKIYIVPGVSHFPTWGDLFKPGQATLKLGPSRTAQAQLHWYEMTKGQAKEIPAPANVVLP